MRDYLLVWRALPKLLIGSFFLVELTFLTFGGTRSIAAARIALQRLSEYFTGATLLIAILMLVGLTMGIGLFLLRGATVITRTIAKSVLRLIPVKGLARSVMLQDLFESPYTIALRTFRERGDYYLEFHELKSSAFGVEALEKIPDIKRFMATVHPHVSSGSPAEIEAININRMLGQDRRTYEIFKDEVSAMKNLFLAVVLTPSILLGVNIGNLTLIMITLGLLVLGFAILPAIARFKRFMAIFLLTAYLDNFTVYKGADIADREGEAFV